MDLYAAHSNGSVRLRPPRKEDAPTIAQIFFDAFRDIYTRNNCTMTFTSADAAKYYFDNILLVYDKVVGAVAEVDGVVVASNFLWVEDVAGLGPISVSPAAQGKGVGAALVRWAVAEARGRGFESVRLTQDAFNAASYALYVSLGFDGADIFQRMKIAPSACTHVADVEGVCVRFGTDDDETECMAVCKRVNGFSRPLRHALGDKVPKAQRLRVAVRDGQIAGYAIGFNPGTHAVAVDDNTMKALLIHECRRKHAEGEMDELQVHIFGRLNPGLARWALTDFRMRLHKNMTYMVLGPRVDPAGVYFPNAIY